MKIVDLLTESRNLPFSVTTTIYTTVGEDEDVPVEVEVTGYVGIERDPYGTGDSPTSYEVSIDTITDAQGNEYSEHDLGKVAWERIQDLAIDQVN